LGVANLVSVLAGKQNCDQVMITFLKNSLSPAQSEINWAIPENIHTIARTAFRNSEGKGGFFELEI